MQKPTIHLTPNEFETVRQILKDHLPAQWEVRVFGSRAGGLPKAFSDLDLLVKGMGPLDLATRAQLNEAFSQSDLVFKVDLVDWYQISTEFQNIIMQSSIPLPFSLGGSS